MANIIDYVKWRGDITFEERPFNIIDNLVFAHLSYLSLENVYTQGNELTLGKAFEITGTNATFKFITKDSDNIKLFELCAKSRRFGNIVISDYVDDTSIKENKQFAALTFHINDKEAVITFRGTDDTIVGWKEDFMLSYCKVPAQEMARQYATEKLKGNKSYYIVGHSKGANLALYAASYLKDSELLKVKNVYLNDGPGFCSDVLDTGLIKRIDSKCIRITPEYCIVGEIFKPEISQSYIVKSTGLQMMQHSILTWQVDENGLETTGSHDSISDQINKIFDKFIEKMDDLHERQAFVNSIFDTMGQNGAVTIEDFMKEGPKAFENLIMTIIGDNPEGLNPLKSVKDNVVEDIKSIPAVKAIEDNKDRKSLLRIVLGIVGGILCFLIPENLIESVFAFIIFILLVAQVSRTIHFLRKCKWDLNKEKTRVTISITLIVSYAIIIVKDSALFILSSILFGIFFLANSYQYAIRFKAASDKLCRARYIFEAVLTFIFGGYLMVSPDVGLTWYTISCGTFFILDAIFEIIHMNRIKKGTITY
ncbi:MAG: DUF2974 domain-containing protein [Butyrivibrio sp.]|nr:DUF2974 domain-containing protein [Butyrivibrio sp.]